MRSGTDAHATVLLQLLRDRTPAAALIPQQRRRGGPAQQRPAAQSWHQASGAAAQAPGRIPRDAHAQGRGIGPGTRFLCTARPRRRDAAEHPARTARSSPATSSYRSSSSWTNYSSHMHIIASMREHVHQARFTARLGRRYPARKAWRHGGDRLAAHCRTVLPDWSCCWSAWCATWAPQAVRDVRLVCEGLDKVPDHYQGPVRDICIQMVRNAVVHGIESTEERAAVGKPPARHRAGAFQRQQRAGILAAD